MDSLAALVLQPFDEHLQRGGVIPQAGLLIEQGRTMRVDGPNISTNFASVALSFNH